VRRAGGIRLSLSKNATALLHNRRHFFLRGCVREMRRLCVLDVRRLLLRFELLHLLVPLCTPPF
jgi:hypothetical protein